MKVRSFGTIQGKYRETLLQLLMAAVVIALCAGSSVLFPSPADAQQTVTEIKAKMEESAKQIADLDAEIAGYQKQLNVISGQKVTLQSQIAAVDISRKKILAQIAATENKIRSTNLKLDELALKITDKGAAIELDERAVASSLRKLQQEGDTTLFERVLGSETFGDGWTVVDAQTAVSEALRQNALGLASDRIVLTDQQTAVNETKAELSKFNQQLQTQRGELDANKRAKEQLLGLTKQTESTYQSVIATKRAQQAAFQAELSALEDSLKVAVNPATIAKAATGILSWPYTADFAAGCLSKAGALGNTHCVTQFFGTTPFSTANPQVYNGSGHNAIDIGMPTGTAVLAALSGVVTDTGNTDLQPGCYSYGKWVLVKHANGLSTLYSHLSSINVSAGQGVSTGSVLGYSGMTGYATGPHLHFGVYVTQATQVLTLNQYRGATTPCANAKMPVAPKDGYLNPMSYL